MPFEDELTDALHDTAHSYEPPLTALVNAGIADGRRRGRRRTLGIVGSVTALALVGIGGTFASGLLAPGHATVGAASGGASRSAASGRSATVPPPAQVAAGPVVSKEQMINTLKSLLPAGSVTKADGTGSGGPGPFDVAGASVVFNDGKGASQIDVMLSRLATPVDTNGPGQSCPDPAYVPTMQCTRTVLADGSVLLIQQGYEYPDKRTGVKDWDAFLTATDGRQVSMSEWNAAQEKGSPVSRPDPVLSTDQMKALVTSSAWSTALASLHAPKPVPAPRSIGMSAQEILARLGVLIPKGITQTSPHGQDGFADVLLNDGQGPGLFQVNVQRWKAGGTQPDYTGATVLPDGSKLILRQEGSEKGGSGAVQRIADLMRPDGLRVVVMEFNAPSQGTAATRTDPVLTLDQLRTLVTSKLWEE
ncbi:hypothetical protein [Streptacidiphilus sp. EB129]|uniref:hypothetical protein n=1 Tax=Streptacidiphilus sp. EB129 TaxID=3156262 RepID=UPI0035183C17